MKPALLLIDIQNDYFAGGRMELAGSAEASLRAKDLLSFFRAGNLPIFHIQHLSTRKDASFFLPQTTGVEIHGTVRPLPGEQVVTKNYPNAFRDTALLSMLHNAGIERLVICGMMTHMCIDATVRAAFDHGFACTVVHDACATRGLAFDGVDVPARQVHMAFLAALKAVYAEVTGSREVVAGLQESS